MKIAIIGGGSAYMPGLAFSFARESAWFAEAELALHDIDADALDLQRRLTAAILRANAAAPIAVSATTELERALDGADFVLTTFRPGGLEARHRDESIPPRYGVIGQETTGPGGLAMALRSIPALLEIAALMQRGSAPDALLLNYTNPVQLVTDALVRHGGVDAIGLCDQHGGEIAFLAGLLGADPHDLETDICGTNHLTWTRAVRLRGADVTPLLWEMLGSLDAGDVDDEYWAPVVRLFPLYGMVASRYLGYYAMHDEILARYRASGVTRAQQIMASLPEIVESYRREADSDDPRPLGGRFSAEHGDFAVGLMAAVVSGEPTRFVLNVPNRGGIEGLPDDAIVELPCTLRGREIERHRMGPMPEQVAGLVLQMTAHARLASEAAVSGDRELMLRALMAHPLVNDISSAEAMLDELVPVS
ncbi:MAG: 6-phospho-beta-glucosidase [Gaiellales bacterium]|jgi:6-phospho-beta-glucosidase|nr:6-phospho-beta-glucosidase [Gaiellales bacterium]